MTRKTFSDTLNRLISFPSICFWVPKIKFFPLGCKGDRVKNDQIVSSRRFSLGTRGVGKSLGNHVKLQRKP